MRELRVPPQSQPWREAEQEISNLRVGGARQSVLESSCSGAFALSLGGWGCGGAWGSWGSVQGPGGPW